MMLFTISGLYASTGPSLVLALFHLSGWQRIRHASTEEHTQPAAKPTANKEAKIFLIHKNLHNQ